MTGNARDWIHYIDLRTSAGTQKEHSEVAEAIKRIFVCEFPNISEALGWN
jgi:thymidylate synthase (FAD)